MTLKITGIKETKQGLEKFKKLILNKAVSMALHDLGLKIGELSSDFVPVEFGILKSTFVVQKKGKGWTAGYNTEYASYQHQGVRKDGTRVIRNRPGGGESFFLSKPIQDNKDYLLNFFNQRLTKYLTI